ncbi:MAG: hypothetical protein WCO93_13410, partial [bacterium]
YGNIFGQIRYGKWDKAFEIAGNPEAGFGFEGSPFGEDTFDCFLWNSSPSIIYKDVFTGFIFYKPITQHIQKVGFPFFLTNFKDSLLRRSSCLGENYKIVVEEELIRTNNKLNQTVSQVLPYEVIYNFVMNIGISVVLIILWLMTGIVLLFNLLKS